MSIWENTEGVVTPVQTVTELIFLPHDRSPMLPKRRIEEEG
jgi:hypothetical protein